MARVAPPRDLAIGMVIGAFFGVVWILYGTSGLPGTVALALRVVAVVVAVGIVVRVVSLIRRGLPADPGSGVRRSMFASRAYVLIVLAEVAALVVGNLLLRANDLGDYTITWIALVVGVHFIGFGWFFRPEFYRLGAIQIVLGLGGVTTGVAGGSGTSIAAVTGLLSGAFYLVGMSVVALRGRFATPVSP